MKKGEMVLVHLSNEQARNLTGNQISPMPAIIVNVWDGEYPQHPHCTSGLNVRVFTDSNDNPLWLTSLPMKFDGVEEMFGNETATFEALP